MGIEWEKGCGPGEPALEGGTSHLSRTISCSLMGVKFVHNLKTSILFSLGICQVDLGEELRNSEPGCLGKHCH